MKKSNRIQRYSASERINHWIVAFCFVFAALSGLGFFFPSLNWLMNILGTPQLARVLHPFIGVVMFAAFLLMFFRYWKHNLIQRDDIEWAKNIHKVAGNQEVGDTGRYNFGQKCVFWLAISSLLLLLASGVVIWRPYFAGAFPIPAIRLALLVHSVSAVVLILVIMVHIYAALWVKGTITAMVEGWVSTSWAKKHHPRWYREIQRKQQENKP
ncbi:formate dehydrogenase cytochrome b556 subunit [Pectobacteriaceae bacterium CE70]|uniref:Formate dehydrogenase cytochrome b556 subunit n=1 Tax=Serratia sp. (strain ATCC 39006) TaxID=104623 RepID=A0A2I5T6S9_SERS3|nr:formate dehydrogenase cytochrome b556 subunit [Serratia sp. ATCC 39006]WJV61218.1 formate dehydrogenase cytochrome b556 subunit [Pectobacteriaceae bacterium C52]WJV65545.1 formate dehydrogenase cytochrome b556 subunit [Pectobacteriaceae bacterium CE70]WJY09565.1 formate dehydrogenase cytochrome b556 subunit [Pectobacteriaceae bacterium C80]AUH00232.1 formate dehydrogenase cytochrome b556 subunit [Serratia sp. ATCC 39006]AUH04552.1 formate dehydrogenase cytochrome b556 subunit [Serratia sp. 